MGFRNMPRFTSRNILKINEAKHISAVDLSGHP